MEEKNQEQQALQQIIDLGAATTKTAEGTIYTLTIIGQIEGHQVLPETVKTTKYEHVLPLLASIEESQDIDGLLLLLNTVGGDIEAGLAIAELIAGMKKPTVSLVLGGGHSIGVPLAVCAKRSMIVPTASMTIHPVRMNGVIVGAPPTYRYFNRIQEQIVTFVTANSRIRRQQFLDYMMQTGEMATARRDRRLRAGGRRLRAHRPVGQPGRRAALPAPDDRPSAPGPPRQGEKAIKQERYGNFSGFVL